MSVAGLSTSSQGDLVAYEGGPSVGVRANSLSTMRWRTWVKLAMCLVSRSSEIDLRDFLVCLKRLTSRSERYQMRNCKPIETPVEKQCGPKPWYGSKDPRRKKREKMSRVPYSSAVRSLMYAMMCTRPDIPFSLFFGFSFPDEPRTCALEDGN